MKKTDYFLLVVLTGFFFGNSILFSQNVADTEKKKDQTNSETKEEKQKNEEKAGGSENPTFTIAGQKISLESAIHYVIQRNLTIKSAKYDVVMSDSDEEMFNQKFTPFLNASGGYTKYKSPASTMSSFMGDEGYQYDVEASLSKIFTTGTMVSVGVKHSISDANDPGFSMTIPGMGSMTLSEPQPQYHQPSMFISIQQELLKNSFGINDRKTKKLLKNAKIMRREAIINQLSGLIVKALSDYWNVTIQKSAVDIAELELKSTKNVRAVVYRNVRYGMSERFEINQYNALVAAAEMKLELAQKAYRDAVRQLLRTINVPVETEVEGVTDLVESLPELDEKMILENAYKKRVDYQNAKRNFQIAQLENDIARNESLPSLKAIGSVTASGQNEQFADSVEDVPSFKYPSYYVGVSMTYPLWNKENKVKRRNSAFRIKQSRIKLEELKTEIRDEIKSRVEGVRLAHSMLLKTKLVRKEAETYYYRLLYRSRQGKFNSVAVKSALDQMIQARQQELVTLVQYNLSLLQLDLSQNMIFERYNVDVDKILSEVH